MSLIQHLRNTYGNTYGIFMFIAYLFYLALGGIWFFTLLIQGHQFSLQAFVMMVAFFVQLSLRKKLMNLILGLLSMFFSLWMLLEVLASYTSTQRDAKVPKIVFEAGIIVALLSLFFAGILVFSYYQAHKNTEIQ